jgi:hypothetical protein
MRSRDNQGRKFPRVVSWGGYQGNPLPPGVKRKPPRSPAATIPREPKDRTKESRSSP